ncbi:MAG TPA: cytochrome b/b6 domain-containing protein, partial [Sphingorhabdus sp.]|nr:cytochrome b/b6 domain-containing protein [Sphingorhabdus sp.]
WIVNLIPEGWVRPAIDTHKSLGITVLGLVLLHVLWRTANPPPPLPLAYAPWERKLAKAAHVTMYVLILALPLSGWMHDSAWKAAAQVPMKLFYLFEWPRIGPIMAMEPVAKENFHKLTGAIHVYLSYAFYALFLLHVTAALKHQFRDRHPQLQRMVPFGKIE